MGHTWVVQLLRGWCRCTMMHARRRPQALYPTASDPCLLRPASHRLRPASPRPRLPDSGPALELSYAAVALRVTHSFALATPTATYPDTICRGGTVHAQCGQARLAPVVKCVHLSLSLTLCPHIICATCVPPEARADKKQLHSTKVTKAPSRATRYPVRATRGRCIWADAYGTSASK